MDEHAELPELFRSFPNPACLWAPVRSDTGKLIDLRFLCFNESLRKHFKYSGLLRKDDMLSRFELPYFDRMLALCEKTLRSGRPRRLTLFVETTMRPCRCICHRTDEGNIIVAACDAPLPAQRERSIEGQDPRAGDGEAEREGLGPFIAQHEREMPYVGELMAQLEPGGRFVAYRPGERLPERDEESPRIGFIVKGYFRQYAITAKGIDCTLALYRVGQILDSSLYRGLCRESTIGFEALSECEVFMADWSDLRVRADADPRWFRLFYCCISSRLAAERERDISLLCEDATARYRRFLLEDGDALPYLRSYHIASYLGVTSETLSRIRSRASGKGPFIR
jgi:CRP-like cAMP-binding protein